MSRLPWLCTLLARTFALTILSLAPSCRTGLPNFPQEEYRVLLIGGTSADNVAQRTEMRMGLTSAQRQKELQPRLDDALQELDAAYSDILTIFNSQLESLAFAIEHGQLDKELAERLVESAQDISPQQDRLGRAYKAFDDLFWSTPLSAASSAGDPGLITELVESALRLWTEDQRVKREERKAAAKTILDQKLPTRSLRGLQKDTAP